MYDWRLGAPFQIKMSPWGIDVLRMFPWISLLFARNSAASNAKAVRIVSQPKLDLVERVAPPGDVDADHEEDQGESDQPATG